MGNDIEQSLADVTRWYGNKAFVYFGRLAPSKGVTVILESWLQLVKAYPNTCPPLWLVGGSPKEICSIRQFSGLSQQIDEYEKCGRIMWWGYQSPSGISGILLRALALITHSKYEPGGRVIVEAMAQGIPTISTPHGFAPDLIADWVSGFLVDFGDKPQLFQRMKLLLMQPLLAHALGIQAKLIAKNAIDAWDFFGCHHDTYRALSANLHQNSQQPFPKPQEYPSVLSNRRVIIPGEIELNDELLLSKLKAWLGEESIINQRCSNGKSKTWDVTVNGERKFIKQQFSHFTLTPLWLPALTDHQCITAQTKFKAEVNNEYPGTVITLDFDEENLLLMMPFYHAINMTGDINENIKLLRQPLDQLSKISIAVEMSKEINKLVSKYSQLIDSDNIALINEQFRATKLNQNSPVPLSFKMSLRLTIHFYLSALNASKLIIPQELQDQVYHTLVAMQKHATQESNQPIVMAHNGVELDHYFVNNDGQIILLDKEKLSYSYKGKDQGQLAAQLLISDPQINIKDIVNRLSDNQNEANLILLWVAIHLIEDLGFLFVGEQTNKLLRVISAWKQWSAVIREF